MTPNIGKKGQSILGRSKSAGDGTPVKPIIRALSNDRVKAWRRLQTRRGRRESGEFLLEGRHLVEEAILSGAGIEEILWVEERDLAPVKGKWAGPLQQVSAAVMKAICETETSQGIVAVCRLPEAKMPPLEGGRFLLLDGIQDPGNLGSLIRTASALGLSAVVLGSGTADAWSGKTVRASQGAVFHVPMLAGDVAEWIGKLKKAGVTVYGSAGAGDRDFREVEPGGSFALVAGNEGAGVQPGLLDLCDAVLRIPLPGRAESLGVAVAAAVLLFHLGR
jgi:TrmH family RNA methyltransferase